MAFTRSELRQRIEEFRDLSIPDEEIRRRYFTRTRSPRYERGDTRGWKLASARRTLAALDDWASFIEPCQYRPLDWRWIFWHASMIDWPRTEVTQRFVARHDDTVNPEWDRGRGGEGERTDSRLLPLSPSPPLPLALIVRRQFPLSEPAAYFWTTTVLTLDGIIRNDNRGSESLFPVTEKSEELACYAYALFHSPAYRRRYAAVLRKGFPRVLMARDSKLTESLVELGRQLVILHTQQPFLTRDGVAAYECQRLLVTVAPRFPQFADGRIWIRDDFSIAAADEATWQFRVGAHQLARKWLAVRRGRLLTDADVAWYEEILATIVQTRIRMTAIDEIIEAHGGFPAAFCATAANHQ